MRCFICNNEHLEKFLDLGSQPPSDAFLREEDLQKPEAAFPLALYLCDTCKLVQLGHIVDPEVLFNEYVYTTGMNNSLRKNFNALVEKLVCDLKLKEKDLAIDIGSNDGTLLENYAAHDVRALGVDPSSAGALAIEKGIPTVRDFWNLETAKRIQKEYGQAKVITATNVFAHVPDLASFVSGIHVLLAPHGMFVSESGYLLDMLETVGYDAIYHEHLRYYSLKPLVALFEQHGMEIVEVERIPSHNGSIRVYAARKGAYPIHSSVEALLREERDKKLYDLETLTAFARKAYLHKKELQKLIQDIRKGGKCVVGIGAPAKGNTLLNFIEASTKDIEYLAEKSEYKIGLFAPGTHIPVVFEERIFA